MSQVSACSRGCKANLATVTTQDTPLLVKTHLLFRFSLVFFHHKLVGGRSRGHPPTSFSTGPMVRVSTTRLPFVGDRSPLRVRERSGHLRKTPRSMPSFRQAQSKGRGPERSLAMCREAGATVRTNTMLSDMNVCVSADDRRSIEVLASGLPLHHGAQPAVDITLRCAFSACGCARQNASHTNGASLTVARTDKERKYHELLASDRSHLVVVA